MPVIPDDLDDWANLIQENMERYGTLEGDDFFQTSLQELDDSILIFVNNQISGLLRDADYLHCDGTFKCVPRKPKSRQLFTIMAVSFNHVSFKMNNFLLELFQIVYGFLILQAFPIVFVIMGKKDQQSYEMMFSFLKEKFGMSSKKFMTDYEKALRNALGNIFPAAIVIGCWFHLAQVIQFFKQFIIFLSLHFFKKWFPFTGCHSKSETIRTSGIVRQ